MSAVRDRKKRAETLERDRRIAEMFKGHVAEFREYTSPEGFKVEELVWKKPGTSCYAIWYRSVGGNLFVTGDLYDAIYVREFGLRWWASCDLSYFASKCMASPEGRGFKSWDSDLAAQNIRRLIAEQTADEPDLRRNFRELSGWRALFTQADWFAWLQDHGWDVFSDPSELGSVGTRVDWLCEAHLYGLKLAFKQLDAKAVAA